MVSVHLANYGKALGLFSVLLLSIAFIPNDAIAQRAPYRITFVDKGQQTFEPGAELYNSTLLEFHPDALQRRQEHGMNPLLTSEDQPIAAPYLAELVQLGVAPFVQMRWRNAVIAEMDTITASQISQLAFIDRVERTSDVGYVEFGEPDNCAPMEYGRSESAHEIINTIPLHDAGVFGQGARIAIIDNGFRLGAMTSLKHVTIDGTYDAIYNDDDVEAGPDEPENQDGHGSLVLSVAAGWQHDSIMGSAPFASYLLVKTEDMRYERRIEEDLYTAGLEWAERNGADITSSSIGYYNFDSTQEASRYSYMDGKTTFADQAISRAVARGVVCLTAAGNDGPRDSSIIIPAAADSVITVGATLRSGLYWPASASGPTADGRRKPDLAALGTNVRCQSRSGEFINASGTSLATPLVAGGIGLLTQLYPELETWTIRNAVYNSCRYLVEEADQLGRGIPDFTDAARTLGNISGPGISPPVVANIGSDRKVFTSVFSHDPSQVRLLINNASETRVIGERVVNDWFQFGVDESLFDADSIEARLIAFTDSKKRRYYPSDSTWFMIPRQASVFPCGVRLPGQIVSVSEPPTIPMQAENRPRIGPSPVPVGRPWVQLFGVADVNSLRLVCTSSGELHIVAFQQATDSTTIVHLPAIVAGHYQLIVNTSNNVLALPFVVF